MAYEPLPVIEVALADLHLDLDNYRIPTHREDEAAALKYLFASEDVMSSATEIIRDGYFDNETPLVTRAEQGYVVLEGNRRVSALKTLTQPDLSPGDQIRQEIEELRTRYAMEVEDLPDRIRVMVAPSRQSVAKRIARQHTGRPKRPWSRDQQATYYYSLLGPTTSFDELRASYPTVQVTRFIKMAVMRRFLAGVKFEDDSLRAYVRSPALKMSALEYAYRNGDIARLIGADFDAEGQLAPRTLTPEQIGSRLHGQQLRGLEYLMNQFRAGILNTRSAAFRQRPETQEHRDLCRMLAGETPPDPQDDEPDDPDQSPDGDRRTGGPGGSQPGGPGSDTSGGSESSGSGQSQGGSRGPNHPDTKDHLDLAGLGLDDAPSNLKVRYQELRTLSLRTHPLAAAGLLRSVLETTIKIAFEQRNDRALDNLGPCMQKVRREFADVRALQDSINRISNGASDKPGSVLWFNQTMHNPDSVLRPIDVHHAFRLISPLLRELLRRVPAESE